MLSHFIVHSPFQVGPTTFCPSPGRGASTTDGPLNDTKGWRTMTHPWHYGSFREDRNRRGALEQIWRGFAAAG